MIKSIAHRLPKYFFHKPFLVTLAILTLYILFRTPIEKFISATLVEHALKYITSAWYHDLIFLLIAVYIMLLVIIKFGSYQTSFRFSLFIFSITIVYSIYRFSSHPWTFKPFSFSRHIYYTDIFFVLAAATLITLLWKRKRTALNNGNSFYHDESLGTKNTDLLGYTNYASRLANYIENCRFGRAFAIGINGKWGYGKTSFIDLVKRTLDKKYNDVILIDFNPWNSNTPTGIIQDFFDTVQEKVRPYHSHLSSLLLSYSNKLVTLNSNTITQSIHASVAVLTGFESLNQLYKEINTSLVNIDKKIIIIIDDLDRLDKQEILEVIRLIRNTANFHNTFFIVAYDRNYIIEALKVHIDYNREQFLEKIFQLEISLPYFEQKIFRYKLFEKLKPRFPSDIQLTLEENIIGTVTATPYYLNQWLENMRDVTRLANALLLNLETLYRDVVIPDFIRLELIRLKFPSVYELLYRYTDSYLTATRQGSDYLYTLSPLEVTKRPESHPKANTYLELYLLQNREQLSVPSRDIVKIIELLKEIFDTSYRFELSHLSVLHPSKYYRYFTYVLSEGNLSEIEFSNARDLPEPDFLEKISEWVEKGLAIELANRFVQIKTFDNRQDFEKIISAIFHLAGQKSREHNFYYGAIVGYDGKDLIQKLNNADNNIVNKYYQGAGIQKLRNFIFSLFSRAESPFTYEAILIRMIRSEFDPHFPLSEPELEDLVVNYLKSYCDQAEKLDPTLWRLFHNCARKVYVPADDHTFRSKEEKSEKAKEIFRQFILNKDLDGFLLAIINVEPLPKPVFAISNIVAELFQSYVDFKNILLQQNQNKWNYLQEFLEFFEAYEASGFVSYISFTFKRIDISQRLTPQYD